MRKFYGLLLLLSASQFSRSQVIINSPGSVYTQNFNSLANATAGNPYTWTDNSTITGWYSSQANYTVNAGSGTAGTLYSYGPSAAPGDVADRALGLLSSGSTNFRFGIQIKNSTGGAITSFSVVYTGEEWRQTANAQKLVFEYSADATSLTTGTWTAVALLDFTAPVTGAAGAVDGNATANRTAISSTVAALVADNNTIWFRWTKSGTTSPGLAIDDISITANNGPVNSLATGTTTGQPFCVDAFSSATGTVAFTSTGTYNTTFTAYLSDATGSFASPVSIGSTAVNGSDPSGTINITIPAGTASATGYKIRVDALSPAVMGSSSTAFEIVNGAKNVSGANASSGNSKVTVSWTNPVTCYDEVMIVAKALASITASPSGNGSAYTASNTFGSGTSFDGGFVVYKGTSSPQTITGLTNGTLYYIKIFTRKGTNWSSGVEVTATPDAQIGGILINQLSPDYGAATDEYIELLNKTNTSIDLSAFVIKYQSSTGGTTTTLGTLSGTIAPGSYWLLSPNATVTVGLTNNLARDGAINSGMASPGQIALIRLSGNTVIDAVGYGILTGGTYTETAAAPAPPGNGGIKRTPDGTDTDNNSADFTTVANASIALRNSAVAAPLSVKFANLRATKKPTGVLISWSNLTESGIRDYTVERSVDGVVFTSLEKINPISNQQNQADYFVIDASPVKGANFYRIRSTETDGKISFSNILRVNALSTATALLLYPNPLTGNEGVLQLTNVPAGQYNIRVINVDGQILSSKSVSISEGSSVETLSVNNLPAGFYTLQVNGPVNFQQRFIKQ